MKATAAALVVAFALLNSASAPPDDAVAKSARIDIGEALATRLDLRSFRSSRHQLTTDDAFTLDALSVQPIKIRPRTAELETPDWYFKLEVIAVADIDGSGKADWLVRVVDQSLSGTYLTVSPLVIYDPGNHGLLRAASLSP